MDSADKALPSVFRLYAFDGNCARSKGGDVDLLFDDGSKLVAWKYKLSSASTILNQVLGKQTGTSYSMKIKGTSSHIWNLLLNLVHCDDDSYKVFVE